MPAETVTINTLRWFRFRNFDCFGFWEINNIQGPYQFGPFELLHFFFQMISYWSFFYVLCTKLFCSTFNEFCNKLNRSKPLIFSNLLLPIFFPKQPSCGFGPDKAIFSMCWCCDRTAKRFTCTGIGTTIFVEPEPLPEFRFIPCDVSPALTLFHLARRFWNLR